MTLNVVSIHYAASLLHATPTMIHRAAEALGIEPHLVVNGIESFLESDVERIAHYLAARRPGGLSPFNIQM